MKYNFFSGLFGAIFISIPFYFIWNALAPIYAYELPAVYQHLPFWHCVGLFVLISILRAVIFPNAVFHRWKFQKWC